jgi:hypothetical protein
MKRITLVITTLCIFTIGAYSQKKIDESSVPDVVKSKFKALYPASKVEYWTRESGNYVAEFADQKKEMIIFITPNGKSFKTETRIHPSQLPVEVREYIAKHYPKKKITDAIISADEAGNRVYEAEVDEMDLIFDVKGRFLKSVKERAID